MAIRVVEFSNGGDKIRKIFCLKINIPKGNYLILGIGLMGKCKKVPKFDFQIQFCTSEIIGTLNNINLGAHFLLLTFFDIFKLGNIFLNFTPLISSSWSNLIIVKHFIARATNVSLVSHITFGPWLSTGAI